MAVAKAKAAPARTAAREEPAARMPERTAMPERDNVIRNRLGEPVQLSRIIEMDDDKYNLDKMGIRAPDGWTYEWKTLTIKGWQWTEHLVELAQRGWTPVPAERHDGLCMPRGHKGNIERGGLGLFERDARLTHMSRQVEKKGANSQLQLSRSMTGLMSRVAPNSSAITDFAAAEAQGASFVRSERAPVPNTPGKYQYSLDE